MEWHPRRWTAAQLEERRLTAARWLRAGRLAQAEIARRLGVSRAAVTQWKQHLEAQGVRGLRRRTATGRPSHLCSDQWGQLLRILRRSATVAGFETERWTVPRITAVVARTFGVRFHPRSLGPALRARGWSRQRPIARARERDDALVAAWLAHEWPRIKRGRSALGVPSSSSTRPGTPSSPGSARRGRRGATHRSCVG